MSHYTLRKFIITHKLVSCLMRLGFLKISLRLWSSHVFLFGKQTDSRITWVVYTNHCILSVTPLLRPCSQGCGEGLFFVWTTWLPLCVVIVVCVCKLIKDSCMQMTYMPYLLEWALLTECPSRAETNPTYHHFLSPPFLSLMEFWPYQHKYKSVSYPLRHYLTPQVYRDRAVARN